MADGSDAIADWPILNALVNTAAGAHWVSVHHGGGVGIGYSIHAGMVVVADGTEDARGAARTGAHERSRAWAWSGTPTRGTTARARWRASAACGSRWTRDREAHAPVPAAPHVPGVWMVRIEGPGGTRDQHLVTEVVREAIAG